MLRFVTTNEGKLREAREYLGAETELEQLDFDTTEIQADDIGAVAAHSAREAYHHVDQPVIVEDSGLFIDALDGFPGPYSSYAEDTLGIERVWHLAEMEDDRAASFRSVIAYCDGAAFEATPEPVDHETRAEGASRDARTGSERSPTAARTGKARESNATRERRGQDQAADERATATTVDQIARGTVPVKLFEGAVPGTLVAPRGDGGFGFDPIFEHDGTTFAEMDAAEKNAVSHRGRALAAFAEWYESTERDAR